MKQRTIALLLSLALCAGLCVPALAAEEERTYDVTWEELSDRVRTGSPNAQAVNATIGQLDAIDYDVMMDKLRDTLNKLSTAQWSGSSVAGMADQMVSAGILTSSQAAGLVASGQVGAGQAGSLYSTLRETFDDLDDGEIQKDNAHTVLQLENALDQMVSGAQTLYITIAGLEQSLEDGDRGLATIDRSLTELRLRHRLGQVSADQVTSLEQTRAGTVSQLETLKNAISTCKLQLQALVGAELTGEMSLAPLPQEIEDDLDWEDLDYDADLAQAKERSWTLLDAQDTLEDAREDYKDNRNAGRQYEQEMAQHAWEAAQATYAAAVQSYETSFKTLYDSLANYQQVWENKRTAVSYQEKLYANAQFKYRLGMISRNSLLSAQDDLESAKSAAESAWRDLFSARNSYRTAVSTGLLSSSSAG